MITYNSIAQRSFKAKWKIYLFKKVVSKAEDTIDIHDFEKFVLEDKLVKQYTNEFWQEEATYVIGELTVQEIYDKIKSYEKDPKKKSKRKELLNFYVKNQFQKLMTKADFKQLTSAKSCYYCKTHIDDIEKLGEERKIRKKNLRGWSLEVERIRPNYEYSKDNCEMSCYWCNNAKTDEFSEDEFKAIGKIIGEVFKRRLNKKDGRN